MAITFDPSSVSFGSVAIGSSVSQTIKVTNSGGLDDATLSLTGSGFTITPSPTVVPTAGSCDVAITFNPVAQASYAATISCVITAGPRGTETYSCSLTGTGVAVAAPVKFESEYAPGSDADVANKYYQVAVPKFALNKTTTAANSFFRMGTFPDDASGFPEGWQASLNLAKLVGDATGITGGELLGWEKTDSSLLGPGRPLFATDGAARILGTPAPISTRNFQNPAIRLF